MLDMQRFLRQRSVPALLLLNMIFMTVLRVADKGFIADAIITDSVWRLL